MAFVADWMTGTISLGSIGGEDEKQKRNLDLSRDSPSARTSGAAATQEKGKAANAACPSIREVYFRGLAATKERKKKSFRGTRRAARDDLGRPAFTLSSAVSPLKMRWKSASVGWARWQIKETKKTSPHRPGVFSFS